MSKTQVEKNEALANDIKKFLEKNDLTTDVRVYFNNKCYSWNIDKELVVLEDIKPSTYFEFANDETVAMSFEGELNHIINYGMKKTILKRFDKIFEKHGVYYELGHAWNLSVYE